jgi:hypothetical protein
MVKNLGIFPQRRCKNGNTSEKTLSITKHQGEENQSHSEMSPALVQRPLAKT